MFSASTLPFIVGAAFASLSLSTASPVAPHGRAVTELNQDAFREAHSRDDSATRTSSNTQVRVSLSSCNPGHSI
jgi:hypothetical protein